MANTRIIKRKVGRIDDIFVAGSDLETHVYLQHSISAALKDTPDAWPIVCAVQDNQNASSINIMTSALKEAFNSMPPDQTILFGELYLGGHYGGLVIDKKNNTAVIFEPFGHKKAEYQTAIANVQQALQQVMPSCQIIINQQRIQTDGISCGRISRDAIQYIVNECNKTTNGGRLQAAVNKLDADKDFHNRWTWRDAISRKNATEAEKKKSGDLAHHYRTVLNDFSYDVMINIPDEDKEKTGDIKTFLADKIFCSSAKRQQFIALTDQKKAEFVGQICEIYSNKDAIKHAHQLWNSITSKTPPKYQALPVVSNGSTSSIQKNLLPVIPEKKPAVPQKAVPEAPAPAKQSQRMEILNVHLRHIPEHQDEKNEIVPDQYSLEITQKRGNEVQESKIHLDKIQFKNIMPNSYAFNENTNIMYLPGQDKKIHFIDFNKPSPQLTATSMVHESYVTSVSRLKSENQAPKLISSSGERVYVWDEANEKQDTIHVPGTKVIMSVTGLDNGWMACADRMGRVYFIDQQKNVFEYRNREAKLVGEQRLSKLKFKNGLITQSDMHGNNSRQFAFPKPEQLTLISAGKPDLDLSFKAKL